MTQYEDKLGRKFSMIFHGLFNEWGAAVVRYKEFRELFGDGDRIRLLNCHRRPVFHGTFSRCPGVT